MNTPSIDQILDYLSKNHVRATYGAVGKLLDLPPRSVGKALGPRSPRASWVVSRDTGKPAGYAPSQTDPALTPATDLIQTAEVLLQRMASNP